MKNIVLMIICLSLSGFSMAQTVTNNISADADTFLNGISTNINYGSETYLWIAPNKNALVHFDLSTIPAGQIIISATLKLYSWALTGNTTTEVYKETDLWTETGATHNTTDGTIAWGGSAGGFGYGMTQGSNVLDTTVVNGINQWFDWNVTSAVQDWYQNPSANHGLLVIRKTYGGSGFKCYAREHGGGAPLLTVVYAPPAGTLIVIQ